MPQGFNESIWFNDYGQGTQVKWYNKKAHSNIQIQKVKKIVVGEKTIKRIDAQVSNAIRLRKQGYTQEY